MCLAGGINFCSFCADQLSIVICCIYSGVILPNYRKVLLDLARQIGASNLAETH